MERAKKVKKYYRLLPLAIVVAISIFTHFYRIDKTFIFHNDEARDALVVKKMIDTSKPVFLGPQTSIGNMYLGPFYYYLMTPAQVLSGGHPVGPAIMVALFGVLTTILLYLFTRKLYGTRAATAAALFYALCPVMVIYSRSSWNPNVIPFFALLVIIGWYLQNRKGALLIGLASGILFQLHYVALILPFLVSLDYLRRKRVSELLYIVIGYFVSSSPFWVFEMRHAFVNTNAFFDFLLSSTGARDSTSYITRMLTNIGIIAEGIIGSSSLNVRTIPSYFIPLILILLGYIYVRVRKTKEYFYLLTGTIVLVSLLPNEIHPHYLAHLYPVIALLIGALFHVQHKIHLMVSSALLVSLFVWYYPTLQYNLASVTSIHYEKAENIAAFIQQASSGKQYNIVAGPGSYVTGVEYVLHHTDNPPSRELASQIFIVCEGAPCRDADIQSPLLLAGGSTHPAIVEYLGHPQLFDFQAKRNETGLSYETYGAHLQEIILVP